MAVRKLQVFLAGRFAEFREVRHALKARLEALRVPPVQAIDLDDNIPDTRSVLSRCYADIDRAELFVLLIGQSYGPGLAEHSGKSYTHLEYERALSDRAKPILPFLITHPTSTESAYSDDQRHIDEWVRKIHRRHTASQIDGSCDTERITNQIFNGVLPWLVELFADVDDPDIEESTDNLSGNWDGLPISREELLTRTRAKDQHAGQPLNLLAANHAREAVAALDLGLRQAAIHHLRQALALMPLDVVPGYWLARLLVTTGRRKEILEGRRYAVRAAQIALKLADRESANKTSDEKKADVQAMACYIVAARASERLGEDAVALDYAQAAHDVMNHHWLAKFELGRQHARRGDHATAVSLAGSAFSLRPDSIRRFQSDAAYHALGRPFKEFYDGLQTQIAKEVTAINDLGPLVRQFATRIGVEPIAETSPLEFGGCDEQADVLDCVRAGRFSARQSLELTKRSAMKLLADASSFAFDGSTGITPETKKRLQDEVDVALRRVETVDQQRLQKAAELRRCEEARAMLTRTVLWGAGIGIAIAAISRSVGADAVIALVVVLGALGLWAAWQRLTTLNDAHEKLSKEAQQILTELGSAVSTRSRLDDLLTSFAQRETSLREQTRTFCNLVNAFEHACVSRLAFAPAVTPERRRVGALIRTESDRALSLNLTIEPDLLPERLKWLVESSAPRSRQWLSCCIRSGDGEILSRSAAYFQTAPASR